MKYVSVILLFYVVEVKRYSSTIIIILEEHTIFLPRVLMEKQCYSA